MPHPTRTWYLRLGTLIALTVSVARASDAQSGGVEGTVMDSVHARALVGVKVLALDARSRTDAPHTAITGPAGRYRIDSLRPGRYMVAFESPLLDSLEIELAPHEADVVEGGVATVDLAVPSVSSIGAAVCPRTILPPGTGAILGRVVSAETEGSLAGVVIAMTWREVDVDRKTLRTVKRERTASVTTDADGWYLACGVPLGTWLSMHLQHGGRSGPVIRTTVGEALGVAIRHLSLSAAASRPAADSGTAGANAGSDAPLSGSAMLSGIVRGVGDTPLSSAEVRVWGTAAMGRTDASGRYSLGALPAGTQMLEVRHIGYDVAEASVELRNGETATSDVQLQRIVSLDSIRIVALRARYREFEAHQKQMPFGIFLGPAEMAQARVALTSDIIARLPGFRIVGYGYSGKVTSGRDDTSSCSVNVVIDGNENQSINDVHPTDIGAIEAYRAGTLAPVRYSRFCGAIIIWTKRR